MNSPVKPLTLPIARIEDGNGTPYSGAKLYVYLKGTTTPATVYSDEDRTQSHLNPVVADAGGLLPPIFPDPTVAYRFLATTAADVPIAGMDSPWSPLSAEGVVFTADAPGAETGTIDDKLSSLPLTPSDFGVEIDAPAFAPHFLAFLEACRDTGRAGYLPAGTYYLAPPGLALSDGDTLTLIGEGIGKSIILSTTSSSSALVNGTDQVEIDIAGVQFGAAGNTTRLISITSTANAAKKWKASLSACRFDISGSANRSALELMGYREGTTVRDCEFEGSPTPTIGSAPSSSQVLLNLGDAGMTAGDLSPQVITGNHFRNGALHFNNASSASSASPMFFSNNFSEGAHMMAFRLYHGEEYAVTDNVVQGCLGALGRDTDPESPTYGEIVANNIGGAVWADLYAPLTFPRHGGICSNNIIRGCTGVGLFVEEMAGDLSGWTILDTKAWGIDDGFPDADGTVWQGGYGLVLTGGCQNLRVNCRVEGSEGVGVLIAKAVGVDHVQQIGHIDLDGCMISAGSAGGLRIYGPVRHVTIRGGTITDNSTAASGTYDDILVDRHAAEDGSLEGLSIWGTLFHRYGGTPSTSRNCLKIGYSGVRTYIGGGCVMHAQTAYIDAPGAIGFIKDSRFVGSKAVTVTGSSFKLSNVEGYETRYKAKLATTGATGTRAINASAMGLGNSASVLAPYDGRVTIHTDGDYNPVLTFSGNDATVKVYKGGALTTDAVSFSVVVDAELQAAL